MKRAILKKLSLTAGLGLTVLFANNAFASTWGDASWTNSGTDNKFSTAANWSGTLAPTNKGLYFMGNYGTDALTVHNDLTPEQLTFDMLVFRRNGFNTAFTITGSDLHTAAGSGIRTDGGSVPSFAPVTHNLDLRVVQNGVFTFGSGDGDSYDSVRVKEFVRNNIGNSNYDFRMHAKANGDFIIDKFVLSSGNNTEGHNMNTRAEGGTGNSRLILGNVEKGSAYNFGIRFWNPTTILTGTAESGIDFIIQSSVLIFDTNAKINSNVYFWSDNGTFITNSKNTVTTLTEWRRTNTIGGTGSFANLSFNNQGSAGGVHIIAPGDLAATGTLSFVNASYNWGGNLTNTSLQYNWDFDLDGSYDTLNFLGKLTLEADNGYLLNVKALNGAELGFGTYTLIQTGDLDSVFALDKWAINWNGFDTGIESASLKVVNGNLVLDVIPEPSTWAMLIGGGTLLLFLRRRRS